MRVLCAAAIRPGCAGARIDKDAKKMWRSALRFSAVGLEMGVAVAIGYGVGWYLDRRFGTKPYLTIIWLLLGIGAAFYTIFRVARELNKMDSMNDEGDDT
jgi:ATP synthase protein I